MKVNKQVLSVILGIAILVIGLMALIFEIRTVPDYSWYDKYDYESKEPIGLYLVGQLMEKQFGEDKITYNDSDTLLVNENLNQLYLAIGEYMSFTDEEQDKLIEFVEAGNTALLVSDQLQLDIPLDNYYARLQTDSLYADSIQGGYYSEIDSSTYIIKSDYDTTYYDLEEGDTTYTYDNYDDDYYESMFDSIYRVQSHFRSYYDSSFVFDFFPFDSIDGSYTYTHFRGEFDQADKTSIISITAIPQSKGESIAYEELAYISYDRAFFIKLQIGEGEIYVHVLPELFMNVSSIQSFYRDHYNYVFSHFDPAHILVDKGRFRFNFTPQEYKKSPLEFVLKTPSLAWAYYLLIATLIAFMIFRGKRLQRIIPVKQKNENTSLQYIKTLSTLYQGQNQNNKLVMHMRDVFYNRIKTKYFLDPKNEKYTELLARKAKVKEREIDTILHKFESAKNSDFNDDQLIVLHNQIESFHKKCK